VSTESLTETGTASKTSEEGTRSSNTTTSSKNKRTRKQNEKLKNAEEHKEELLELKMPQLDKPLLTKRLCLEASDHGSSSLESEYTSADELTDDSVLESNSDSEQSIPLRNLS